MRAWNSALRCSSSAIVAAATVPAAAAVGVDTARSKLATFVLAAVLAALGGALLTHYNGSIGPSEASAMKSVRYVAIVAVGGMDNLWGALAMGVVLNFLSLRGVFGRFDDAVFAGILLGVMLFLPGGLLRRQVFESLRGAVRRLARGRPARRVSSWSRTRTGRSACSLRYRKALPGQRVHGSSSASGTCRSSPRLCIERCWKPPKRISCSRCTAAYAGTRCC